MCECYKLSCSVCSVVCVCLYFFVFLSWEPLWPVIIATNRFNPKSRQQRRLNALHLANLQLHPPASFYWLCLKSVVHFWLFLGCRSALRRCRYLCQWCRDAVGQPRRSRGPCQAIWRDSASSTRHLHAHTPLKRATTEAWPGYCCPAEPQR